MYQNISKILRPLASLKLTVALLALAMILIFAGTTVQTEMGIWDVQHIYFHSWLVMLQWRLFFPLWDWGMKNVPGAVPFPGGYSLLLLLLVNLLAAHSVRFKLSWKRSGIFLIHGGLILLILGEVVTAESAREGQMPIENGSSANFIQDIREVELAIIDPSPANYDDEIIVPVGRLVQMGTIEHPKLPFIVKIDNFYPNSDILGPVEAGTKKDARATAGNRVGLTLVPLSKFSGTESDRVDLPGGYVTLISSGQPMATYLLFAGDSQPQTVKIGEKEYRIHLRFKRTYKPYTLQLLKFTHDVYQGTAVPKNFASRMQLIDPSRNVDREVLIWMNHPLRYAGETFYQAKFMQGDTGTILQVVRNPGWLIPYISCTMVGLGLLVHFGMHLMKFLSGLRVPSSSGPEQFAPQPYIPEPAIPKRNGKGGKHRTGTIVKERPALALRPSPVAAPAKSSRLPALFASGICLLYLFTSLFPGADDRGYDLDSFARVPVSFDGRTMPMDTLARNTLRILSGRSELTVNEEKLPAIDWLLDVFSDPNRSAKYNVFRIDHPEIRSRLTLDDSRKLFSFNEITADQAKLIEQVKQASNVPEKQQDLYQRKIIELWGHLKLFDRLADMKDLYVSPPLAATEWRTLSIAAAGTEQDKLPTDPGAAAFLAMISARAQNMPSEFRSAAKAYFNLLEQQLPGMTQKLDIEVLFNRAQPFITSMALYVIVFLLAAGSWLKWHGALSRAALWVLVLTFAFHTLGLVTRMYLQGRPPVTNLYSSAIFIAWVAVGFCIAMELIYRNGVASAAAAGMAFPSLLIAHYLAGSGDTMQMLQAVLDTNIWLATHVVVVTMGYAATFLGGFLAIAYVLGGLLTTALTSDVRKTFYRMVYGIVCFAMLFSFVGTILGGIWADQSWGRFWGWDPKENGAVLIVLWNAIVLHSRWGGVVKERGFMLLAIFGNVVTAWSWFGTNMLGVGLHSYGFMDSALFWLLAFASLQLGIIATGMIPLEKWKSMGEGRSFLARPI